MTRWKSHFLPCDAIHVLPTTVGYTAPFSSLECVLGRSVSVALLFACVSSHYIFIKCGSAFETGHLHDFGNGVFLLSIELFGTGQVAWLYLVNRLWPPTPSPSCARSF